MLTGAAEAMIWLMKYVTRCVHYRHQIVQMLHRHCCSNCQEPGGLPTMHISFVAEQEPDRVALPKGCSQMQQGPASRPMLQALRVLKHNNRFSVGSVLRGWQTCRCRACDSGKHI